MKAFEFVFSPAAINDMEESRKYYEELQTGLGKKFILQLTTTINAIKRNPFFAAVRYNDIRCAQIKRFPYLVHYHVDEKKMIVRILAVYSTYKEPLV